MAEARFWSSTGTAPRRILHNLSLLFERTFTSVQDLNRYRKEIAARLKASGAAPQPA